MKKTLQNNENLEKLGYYYVGYRLLIALSIFLILLLSEHYFILSDSFPYIFITIGAFYITLCVINFLVFKFYPVALRQQLFIYLFLDVFYLTIVLFLSSGPNVAIILLYMVVVLAATMLLKSKQAFFLTLLSVIAVVYQQFFFNLFSWDNSNFLGTSSLITLVFLSTYALGQLTNRRFQFIEKLAVTERSAFLQLQQINQNIIEQLDTGFLVIDQQNKIVMLNDAARTLLELPISALHNEKNYLNAVQPQLHESLKNHQEKNFKGFFNMFLHHEEDIGVAVKYRPIITHEQDMTLLIIESLQKITQHSQQLKLASLGQLSASIAHEIRNPLAAISQANELLEEDLPEDLTALTKMIQKQCNRINHTIEETLNMARQNQTLPEDLSLYKWLRLFITEDLVDVQKYLRLVIEDKTYIYFDPHQLRLVMINLIRNAIRHGHEHTPHSRVEIRAQRAGGFIFIDILDEGMGISEQQQKNLFEPFFSTSTNGTGLGLYLSRTFCEANQARLKYIPQTQGACFRIECLASENK